MSPTLWWIHVEMKLCCAQNRAEPYMRLNSFKLWPCDEAVWEMKPGDTQVTKPCCALNWPCLSCDVVMEPCDSIGIKNFCCCCFQCYCWHFHSWRARPFFFLAIQVHRRPFGSVFFVHLQSILKGRWAITKIRDRDVLSHANTRLKCILSWHRYITALSKPGLRSPPSSPNIGSRCILSWPGSRCVHCSLLTWDRGVSAVLFWVLT